MEKSQNRVTTLFLSYTDQVTVVMHTDFVDGFTTSLLFIKFSQVRTHISFTNKNFSLLANLFLLLNNPEWIVLLTTSLKRI